MPENDLNLFEEELNEISLNNEKELKSKSTEKVFDSVKLSELKNKLFPVQEPKKIKPLKELEEQQKNSFNSNKGFSINFLIFLIFLFIVFLFLLLVFFIFF